MRSADTKLGRTKFESPAPDGPGLELERLRPASTSKGAPERWVMIGKSVQPLVSRRGPLSQALANGNSQLPLKAIKCVRSKSEVPSNRFQS